MKTLLIDDCRNIEADVIARTFDAGIHALKYLGPFDILYLDHDLGEEDGHHTGYGIITWLEQFPEYLPGEIKIITANPVGLQQMRVVRDKFYAKKGQDNGNS